MKRIIFDIGHPAQVHNFKCVHAQLLKDGWDSKYSVKNKEVALSLVKAYNIPHYRLFSNSKNNYKNIFLNFLNVIYFGWICVISRPDIIVTRGSFHSIIISKILKISHIMLSDTEHSRDFSKFADVVITNKSYRRDLGINQIRIDANIELFYLHPNKFVRKVPHTSSSHSKKVLMRFVSWNAHHDLGMNGLSLEQKIEAVKEFSKYAVVHISSEKGLPIELESNKIRISPETMHDFISECDLVYGESATMASEAAVLGIPAIYHDNTGRGYTDEEEDFGLVFNYSETKNDQNFAIQKGIEILNLAKEEISKRHEAFLKNKIDPTNFLVWFIENYPESKKIMKENPDYQYNFR
jgi:predicted glycosyltransferase